MVKVIRSSVLSARMVPPWSSTISLAMAKPRPAPPVRWRGAVQTEELFKDPVQFLLGDVLSRIGEGEYDFPGLYPSGNFHRAVRQAIIRRVAQEIIKDPWPAYPGHRNSALGRADPGCMTAPILRKWGGIRWRPAPASASGPRSAAPAPGERG